MLRKFDAVMQDWAAYLRVPSPLEIYLRIFHIFKLDFQMVVLMFFQLFWLCLYSKLIANSILPTMDLYYKSICNGFVLVPHFPSIDILNTKIQ